MQRSKILFISTFPPKKCGIASFTQALVNAIEPETTEDIDIEVCALDKKGNANFYEYPVSLIMDSWKADNYIEMAAVINKDAALKLICLEHEFSLYGGEMEEYLLGFLSMINKPFIVRFYTVLPHHSAKMLSIVKAISLLAEKIIVMTKNAARITREYYVINADKIIIIPHGTHAGSLTRVTELNKKYNLENKQVLTTFGLLSQTKALKKASS